MHVSGAGWQQTQGPSLTVLCTGYGGSSSRPGTGYTEGSDYQGDDGDGWRGDSRPGTGYRAGGTGYTDSYEPHLVQTPTMVAFESRARGDEASRPGTGYTQGGGVGSRPASRGGSMWGGSVLSDAWSVGLEDEEGAVGLGAASASRWPFPLGKMETHYDLVMSIPRPFPTPAPFLPTQPPSPPPRHGEVNLDEDKAFRQWLKRHLVFRRLRASRSS